MTLADALVLMIGIGAVIGIIFGVAYLAAR